MTPTPHSTTDLISLLREIDENVLAKLIEANAQVDLEWAQTLRDAIQTALQTPNAEALLKKLALVDGTFLADLAGTNADVDLAYVKQLRQRVALATLKG